MRSWSILLLLKRLAPLVVIVAGVMGYQYYQDSTIERHVQQDREIARLTARVWLASAVFREHPDKYIAYRDSVMAANDISNSQMNDYLTVYGENSEDFSGFTLLVKHYVDSLSDITLWRDQLDVLTDSLSEE